MKPKKNNGISAHTEDDDDTEDLLRNYLNLEPNLTALYEQWSAADANFKKRAPKFTGIRILKQDPWEALIGFICSSNNNISRISQMVNNLCLHYGSHLGQIQDTVFHDFPTPEALAVPGLESHLRDLGFGYRAKYIATTANIVAKEKPSGWLDSLSNHAVTKEEESKDYLLAGGRPDYRNAHEALLELQGVGPKVADCVCLMGLGWGESVPVDTHVWQFAQRDYKFGKGKHRSLTKATYDAIGDHFRQLWGIEAGWAHSVLFAADLRTFAVRLAEKTEIDMDEVKAKKEGEEIVEDKVVIKRAMVEDIVKDEPLEDNDVSEMVQIKPAKRSRRR